MDLEFFASPRAFDFLVTWNIDKLIHIGGGILIGGLYERVVRTRSLATLLAAIVVIAVGWEVFELLFDPNTRYFYAHAYDFWRLDAIGDITGGVLGCYAYWAFIMERDGNKTPAA